MLNETTKGYIATVTAMTIIGFSFLLVKISLSYASPLDVLMHRFIVAFIGILPIAVWRRRELKFTCKDIPALLMMALMYPILSFGLQVWGLSYISSAEAGIIQAIQPLVTMAIAFFILHEIISFRQRLFALLSVLGVLFIFIMHGVHEFGGALGYLLLLLSVVIMSTYSVFVRKFKDRFSAFPLTFFCISIGALFFTILSVSYG